MILPLISNCLVNRLIALLDCLLLGSGHGDASLVGAGQEVVAHVHVRAAGFPEQTGIRFFSG